MIPRILVPRDVRPVSNDELKKPARRTESYMDERTVVPAGISDAPPLDGKSTIPAHFPLGVLVDRTLVPRGIPAKAFDRIHAPEDYVPIAVMDERTVVPAYVEPAKEKEIKEFMERAPEMTPELREVVEPDIFLTGDANLLVEPEVKQSATWDLTTRSASVLVHILLIIFIVAMPKLFPAHVPTRAEIELASRSLGVTYISADDIPKSPPGPPGPKVRVSPKVLNTVAPPRPESHAPVAPPANPEKPPTDLPAAPTPHVPVAPAPSSQPTAPQPSQLLPAQPPPQPGKLKLNLPNASPGKVLEGQMQDAIAHGGGGSYSSIGRLSPGGGGIGGRGGGGGGGGGQVGNAVTVLTPTEGVDFNSYIQRMLATVKRNWFAVMPESAIMGDKGMVFTTFQINSDGSVPQPDPLLERTSGKDPLDTAAMSAIRASSPFEPLPPQFHGPYIRIRLIFLYNLPIDYANSQ